MSDSRRMMVMPAEAHIPVKRQSGKNQTITMRDVAKSSGFSPATVSIVLNNAPLARYIAPATKKRIEEVAKKLGYRPNAMARFLRSKRSHSVGVMFFDITDPFCTPVLRGNDVSSVMVDNEAGGRLALEHLHHLGHRKIAFIRGPKMLIDSGPRWKGIQK